MKTTEAMGRFLYVYAPGIGVPLLVLVLFSFAENRWDLGAWTRVLPHINAALNALTSVCLLAAAYHARGGRIKKHRAYIGIALALGALFLVFYLLYHSSSDPTRFGDINRDGTLSINELKDIRFLRPLYLILLVSHTLFATSVVALVLQALYYAKRKQWKKHKKWVRFAFPIWLYVSTSGCLVYVMIRPYY